MKAGSDTYGRDVFVGEVVGFTGYAQQPCVGVITSRTKHGQVTILNLNTGREVTKGEVVKLTKHKYKRDGRRNG